LLVILAALSDGTLSPPRWSQLAAPVPQVPWILDARVTCRAHGHHALLERRERAGHKALDAPRAVDLGRGWAGIKCGESCEREQDEGGADHGELPMARPRSIDHASGIFIPKSRTRAPPSWRGLV
jgi:hypothetical protein